MTRLVRILAVLAVSAMPIAAQADPCAAPPELTAASDTFPNAARALARGQRLEVLVLGSASSTVGGTSAPARIYPVRLEAALRELFPGVTVNVTIRGGRGLVAADMVPMLEDALGTLSPNIVIWQTGTVDAVRGVDPEGFLAALAAGVTRTEVRKADLVLMDMQFSRFGRAAMNYGPYRDAMKTIAATSAHTAFFPRYDLMRYWAEAGQIDVERAARPDWPKVADLLHACLGRALAASIADGIRLSR